MGNNSSKRTKNGTLKQNWNHQKARPVVFYQSVSGREPVREWLKQLDPVSRKKLGEDLLTLQLGWPLGMPLAKKIETGLWEQRSKVENGIARILFTVAAGRLILLHGFVKKSRKIPSSELELARKRLAIIKKSRKS